MARNRSEKGPRLIAERMVKPASLRPVRLILKADGNGAYSVWIGYAREFRMLDTSDEREARQVYNWFSDDFYYLGMPGWNDDRWKPRLHAA